MTWGNPVLDREDREEKEAREMSPFVECMLGRMKEDVRSDPQQLCKAAFGNMLL